MLPFINQPGTNPSLINTKGDNIGDDTEINEGTDPTDINDPGPLQTLSIDFNSTSQDGGPHPVGLPYQDYNAAHDVAADFVHQTYNTFGGSMVGIMPSWPDTPDNCTMQMFEHGTRKKTPSCCYYAC